MGLPKLLLAGLCVVATVSGCGGSETAPPAPPAEPSFAVADLPRLLGVRPATPGWDWPEKGERPPAATRAFLETYEAPYALQRTLNKTVLAAGFVRTEASTWLGGRAKGSVFATLFDATQGARTATAAGAEFARRWFPEVEQKEVREVSAKGLGDEAWGLRGGEPSETEFVEISWRRGNVLLKIDVFCTQCSAVIEEVTLDWARAIDEEAQRGT